jgi:hypothetical protein
MGVPSPPHSIEHTWSATCGLTGAGGFTFVREGVGEYFMRLDATDAKAPFKGEVGERTIWSLRAN